MNARLRQERGRPSGSERAERTGSGASSPSGASPEGDDRSQEPSSGHRDLVPLVDSRHNADSSHEGSMLSYDEIPTEVAEALRNVINRYELRTGNALPRTIAVTSARPGEGATTISQSLATLIAQEIGQFVCWVDCSWMTARPIAGSENRPSLIELLKDSTRIHSAFRSSSDLAQLVSLSPGPVPASSRNMIVRSPEFEKLLVVLRDEFDHVIFDLPPVLSNANSLALLRESDATLLVVRHRSTSLGEVDRTARAMEPTENLGVVLNRFRTRIPTRLRRMLGD